MLFSKTIIRFVSGMLFLWLFSTLTPTLSLLLSEPSDQIEMAGNMTEDPQQEEEKKESKKDWVLSDVNKRISLENIIQNTIYFNSIEDYKTPYHKVVLPPPEV
ncbi:MAG: Uncharacterised protein [SAR116 cluster bacterium]|jgi:hypothetical protein|nr:MAG: Uncharacterised protein [SAR116 cluster bacterium]